MKESSILKGVFYQEIRGDLLGEIEKRINSEMYVINEKVNKMKEWYTGALVITGLVASLVGVGGGVLYSNYRVNENNKILEQRVSGLQTQIEMPQAMMQMRMEQIQKKLDTYE